MINDRSKKEHPTAMDMQKGTLPSVRAAPPVIKRVMSPLRLNTCLRLLGNAVP